MDSGKRKTRPSLESEYPIPMSMRFKWSSSNLDELRKSTVDQNDVALSLAKHVISTSKATDRNFVFSPLSIHVVLGMIAAGSSGPTRDQLVGYFKSGSGEGLKLLTSKLVDVMFADGEPLGGPRLSMANGVWVDRRLTLKPGFKDVVESDYKSACNQVDFENKLNEAIAEVNAWAAKVTKGLITDVISPSLVNPDTKLMLANALYFKGDWCEKFDPNLTRSDRKFFLLNGHSIDQVPFMTSYKDQYISAFDDFKVLRLPYKYDKDERRFSMCVVLPDAKDGLPALVKRVGSESGFIERHVPRYKLRIGDFLIPKFKIDFNFEASEVLKRQGLDLPFRGSGLTEVVESDDPEDNLYVSRSFQKAFIEVNEEGTEAYARSLGILMPGGAAVVESWDFVADHPFMFVLREDLSGVVLFVGQVVNPLSG